MHGSSLVPSISADALRSAIRAGQLLREIRSHGSSLSRGLRSHSSVRPLYTELVQLRGLGDLLAPVSTTGEIAARTERLDKLLEMLPAERTLLDLALIHSDKAKSKDAAGDDALSASLRGALIAADERDLRALDKKVAALYCLPAENFSGQLQSALLILQHESADWRLLENSSLANRLIGDHGFTETYSQARKRARGLIKAQAHRGKGLPKVADLRSLRRWHESVEVQLRALAGGGALGPELETLSGQLVEFGEQLADWLALVRLRRVPELAKARKSRLSKDLETRASKLLVFLQQTYGLSKANFRALIVSELA